MPHLPDGNYSTYILCLKIKPTDTCKNTHNSCQHLENPPEVLAVNTITVPSWHTEGTQPMGPTIYSALDFLLSRLSSNIVLKTGNVH